MCQERHLPPGGSRHASSFLRCLWISAVGVDLALMWSQTLLPVGDFQNKVGQCCGEQERGLRVVKCTLVKNTTRAESARGTPYQASQNHPLFTLCLCHQHGLL